MKITVSFDSLEQLKQFAADVIADQKTAIGIDTAKQPDMTVYAVQQAKPTPAAPAAQRAPAAQQAPADPAPAPVAQVTPPWDIAPAAPAAQQTLAPAAPEPIQKKAPIDPEMMRAMRAFSQHGKTQELVNIFHELGAADFTKIKPEQYEDLKAKLREHGADL